MEVKMIKKKRMNEWQMYFDDAWINTDKAKEILTSLEDKVSMLKVFIGEEDIIKDIYKMDEKEYMENEELSKLVRQYLIVKDLLRIYSNKVKKEEEALVYFLGKIKAIDPNWEETKQ